MKGLAALLALAALIGGVPWLLWNFAGAPWEAVGQPSEWLSSELDASAITAILVAVLWIAWAYFVVCVAVEAVRAVQHRPTPARGAGAQPLARRLVAGVLLLAGTATATAPMASASAATDVSGHSVAASTVAGGHTNAGGELRTADDARTGGGAYTGASVRLGGTNGSNVVNMSGSGALTSDAMTAKAAKLGLAVYVQPPQGRNHDCLWDIAERTLGDGTRWTEIYQLNKGRLQDDGNRLADPDLIYPGWRMLLPDDARGPDVLGPDGTKLQPHTDKNTQHSNLDGATAQDGTSSVAPEQADSFASSSVAEPIDHPTLYAQLGLGGGLIAAGLLWGLRRRRGWNGGDPPGRGSPFEEEQRLLLRADRPAAIFADRAMRSLGQQGVDAPRPSTARLNQDKLTVRFTAPVGSPPLGWTAGSDQYEWCTTPDTLRDLPSEAPSAASQLICIGTDQQDQVLVNLAGCGGVVAVTGDRKVSTEIARSVVVDLATHAWADAIEVLAVGFHEDLAPLGGGRLRQFATLEEAIAHVRGTVQHQRTERVIVSTEEPAGYDAAALLGFATDRTQPVGVLVCGSVERAGMQLSVNADGVVVPAGWGMALRAQRLPAASIPPLVALYGTEPVAIEPDAANQVPGYDPRLADPAAAVVADVHVLGAPSVQTAGTIDAEREPLASEIVTALALHPDGVHQRVLEGMIWPRGATEDVVSATLEHTKRWLTGPDGVEALRLADGRWYLDLSRVRVDWHVLRMSLGHGAGPILDGLRRVDGVPLAELPAGRYGWVTPELTRQVNATVVESAEAAASEATSHGDRAAAIEALRRGLRGVPDAEVLWRRLLRVSAADGGTERVGEVVDEMFATLQHRGSPRGPEGSTLALVDELVPGHPRSRSELSA